jgi:hypothetical protein
MIDEEWGYFAPGRALTPGGPSTWFILDWDQRRTMAVTMDEAQESEDGNQVLGNGDYVPNTEHTCLVGPNC